MKETNRFGVASFVVIIGGNFLLMVGAYLMGAEAIWERDLLGPYFVGGILATLVLWGLVLWFGTHFIRRAAARAVSPAAEPARPSPAAEETATAVQMLSILQRQGRLIDFLQEDLGGYDDAQIGAAVRNIHAGMKSALSEHVVLEPVFQDQEGAEVTIDAGFDPRAIRLTGDVTGAPPFRGEVRHRGWRVVRVELPQRTSAADGASAILAPAEVEVKSHAT